MKASFIALIASASALRLADVPTAPKSVDPWVHDYIKDNVNPVPFSRPDKAPAANSYPPYGNSNPYWPTKELNQSELNSKILADAALEKAEGPAPGTTVPAEKKAPNAAPTEEEQAAAASKADDVKAKKAKDAKEGAGAP